MSPSSERPPLDERRKVDAGTTIASKTKENEHTDVETIGLESLNSLYCNRPQTVRDVDGPEKWAYIRNFDAEPWRFIPNRPVYQIIPTGLCSAMPRLNEYELFYYA